MLEHQALQTRGVTEAVQELLLTTTSTNLLFKHDDVQSFET